MGFLRYDDEELTARLQRAVELRWPQERLLLVVPCTAERTIDPPPGLPPWRSEPDGIPVPGSEREPGALAVTEQRVVFFQRTRGALVLRMGAALFLAMALMALLSDRLWGAVIMGTLGGALWVAARVAEDAAIDHGEAPFTDLDVDLERQELRPAGRWSRIRRVLVPDPAAFRSILRLIYRPPATSLGG